MKRSLSMKRSLTTFVVTMFLAGVASVCRAHPAQLVSANVQIHADGSFRVTANFDLLAFALNDVPARIDDASMNQLLDGPTDQLEQSLGDAARRLLHGFTFRCNQSAEPIRAETIHFPSVADVYRWRDTAGLRRLPVIQQAVLEGHLPPETQSVAVRFPEVLATIVLSVERPGEEPYSEPLEAGRFSSILPIRLQQVAVPTVAMAQAAEPTHLRAAIKYLVLGFTHIVPRGPDHILFVLGLFLLSTKLRPLLWQVTAFTLAHSITLGLAMYGVLRLPAAIVEPLIALSIAFVAVENLFTTDLKPWRPFVVFGFGLVHGLGFAGVLTEMGLPRSQFATALVSFNVGVELGQLAVIVAAFAIVGWWRRRSWYRGAIVLPASTVIAAVALFWTIQRVWIGI
jgi:hypothetical protein